MPSGCSLLKVMSECPGLIATVRGVIAVVAMFVLSLTTAGNTVLASAHAVDFFVVYGAPSGLALIISVPVPPESCFPPRSVWIAARQRCGPTVMMKDAVAGLPAVARPSETP